MDLQTEVVHVTLLDEFDEEFLMFSTEGLKSHLETHKKTEAFANNIVNLRLALPSSGSVKMNFEFLGFQVDNIGARRVTPVVARCTDYNTNDGVVFKVAIETDEALETHLANRAAGVVTWKSIKVEAANLEVFLDRQFLRDCFR